MAHYFDSLSQDHADVTIYISGMAHLALNDDYQNKFASINLLGDGLVMVYQVLAFPGRGRQVVGRNGQAFCSLGGLRLTQGTPRQAKFRFAFPGLGRQGKRLLKYGENTLFHLHLTA